MTRYKLTIAYDGTCYSGWQVQKNGISIQALVQTALETILRHPANLTGSSRTDAGVHALSQAAHFDTHLDLAQKFLFSINALLPLDIRILKVEKVADDFHSRYSAKGKIYHYHLHLDRPMNPFVRLYRHHVHGTCDLPQIEKAIPYFLGTHDFSAFSNHSDRGIAARDPVRTIARIDLVSQPGGIRLEYEADGFLYKMVRNITGTLLEVGRGKMDPSEIPHLFASRDRRLVPTTAPAQALFLVEIKY